MVVKEREVVVMKEEEEEWVEEVKGRSWWRGKTGSW